MRDCADGATYDHDRDHDRIVQQRELVWDLMKDGKWRTLGTISHFTHQPEASISARLRDFRKEKYGGYTVERRYVERGLWEYRVEVSALPLRTSPV